MGMLQTMRWFGPNDLVSLNDIRQAGCTGVVTSLHQHPAGLVWSVEDIQERIQIIEAANESLTPLHWAVVESVLIHDDIKRGLPSREQYIATFQQTIRNLAACGVHTICYNFMPVLDWTRTDVKYKMPDGSLALRFVWEDIALFDICILKRPDAENDYEPELVKKVWERFETATPESLQHTKNSILMGLPGTGESFEEESFKKILLEYKHDIGEAQLRENLYYFLRAVVPVAEEVGAGLCIHPDDPPFPLLGLPRVVSTAQDLEKVIQAIDSPANGITFCTGSLGARADNDLPTMLKSFAHKIHFLHLRSVKKEEGTRNFFEANHLAGDADMYAIIKEIIIEQQRREEKKDGVALIPMRPDHGHVMLDDLTKKSYPGYSAIGRLRGLAELRGVELAIERAISESI
jgi:mannonate dehydratase